MTSHFFNHPLVDLHYYRFGHGPKAMLCFHGYGMHGRQFTVLEEKLGSEYTFYGFDLFFHCRTTLKNQSLNHIKEPINKADFAALITDFCAHEGIDRFSVIAYSMGTHYASVLTELKAAKIDHLLMLAPSFLRIFLAFKLLAKNRLANFTFYRLFMSKNAIKVALKIGNKLRLIEDKNYRILCSEMATPEMRFAFYANVTYLRYLETKPSALAVILNAHQVKSHFIFGKRDRIYHSALADGLIAQLDKSTKTILDEDHDMVNHKLSEKIYPLLYDH
jgi:pimeloyl-ACP methyl ester carboxylesterase